MGARILVADDSVTIQKVVELTFSKEDFVLVQARSGEEAIRKSLEVRPDLVLLDMVMPDKNGYEVCAALRAEPTLRSVPIILLTGTFETLDKEQGLQAGANDFITKPFESQVLISKVKQLLFSRMVEKGAPAATRPVAPRAEAATGGTLTFAAAAAVPPVTAPRVPAPTAADTSAPSAAAPPGKADLDFELSPPSEEISQDRLWQLLDSPPPTAAGTAERPGEMSLDDLTAVGPAPTQQPPLELASLDLESAGEAGTLGEPVPPAQAAEAEVAPLPESLSLEDLLSTPPAASTPTKLEPQVEEAAPGVPVFDLTPDMGGPSLPLKEVGMGEPPALSVEDLLGSVPAGLSEPGRAPMEVPELDLGSIPESLGEEELSASEPLGQSAAPELDVLAEPSPMEVPPADPADLGAPAAAEDWTIEAQVPVAPAVPETPPVTAAGEAATSKLSLGPDLDEEQATIPFPSEVAKPDLASMRQAVTERVARDLTRELSDKLADRIEKIVWEVVPDLAEVLITKEIERIRAMAENQKPS